MLSASDRLDVRCEPSVNEQMDREARRLVDEAQLIGVEVERHLSTGAGNGEDWRSAACKAFRAPVRVSGPGGTRRLHRLDEAKQYSLRSMGCQPAVYLTLVGLFAMGLGAIMRDTAAGIASFAGIMFVVPPLISILPSSITNSIDPYLPSNAGEAMMKIVSRSWPRSAMASKPSGLSTSTLPTWS
jgi:hypothetical protein